MNLLRQLFDAFFVLSGLVVLTGFVTVVFGAVVLAIHGGIVSVVTWKERRKRD